MKCLIGMMVIAVMLIGCGTPKQVAYKTLAATGVAVNSAADSYALARAQGLVDDKDWAQAVVLHNQFLVAYKVAVAAASGDLSKYTPDELVKLEVQLMNVFAKRKGQ